MYLIADTLADEDVAGVLGNDAEFVLEEESVRLCSSSQVADGKGI